MDQFSIDGHKIIFNKRALLPRRKILRNNATPAERRLWSIVKGSKLGMKFRRQASIDKYIVDFYCPSHKVVVELDGEVHRQDDQHRYDVQRDKNISDLGITILRFENRIVFENPDFIISSILKTTPQPPP